MYIRWVGQEATEYSVLYNYTLGWVKFWLFWNPGLVEHMIRLQSNSKTKLEKALFSNLSSLKVMEISVPQKTTKTPV